MTNQFPEYTDDYYFSREKLLRECLPYLDVYSEAITDYQGFFSGKSVSMLGFSVEEKVWLRKFILLNGGKAYHKRLDNPDIIIFGENFWYYDMLWVYERQQKGDKIILINYMTFSSSIDSIWNEKVDEYTRLEEEKKIQRKEKAKELYCDKDFLSKLNWVSEDKLSLFDDVFYICGRLYEHYSFDTEEIYDKTTQSQLEKDIKAKFGQTVNKQREQATCVIMGDNVACSSLDGLNADVKYISYTDFKKWLTYVYPAYPDFKEFRLKYSPSQDVKLRPYQQEAKNTIFEIWKERKSVMLQMPTGAGKTVLFSSVINDIVKVPDSNILIIVHRTELVDQIDSHLQKYNVEHGIIASNRPRNLERNVQIASIQTITHKNNEHITKEFIPDFIIVDEAHHTLANTYNRLWKLYPNSWKLGVTATPCRLNCATFGHHFDRIVESLSVKELIKEGYLSDYTFYTENPDSDLSKAIESIKGKSSTGDYRIEDLLHNLNVESHIQKLILCYTKYAEGLKGIVYAISIEHAHNICEAYKTIGVNAEFIDSKTPKNERDQIVEKFRAGQVQVMVNVDIFSEGFDCPDIGFIQMARPTWSLSKYMQQVGRGLRISADKDKTVILDNAGMFSRFGLPSDDRPWRKMFSGSDVRDSYVNNIITNNNILRRKFGRSSDLMLKITSDQENKGQKLIDNSFTAFTPADKKKENASDYNEPYFENESSNDVVFENESSNDVVTEYVSSYERPKPIKRHYPMVGEQTGSVLSDDKQPEESQTLKRIIAIIIGIVVVACVIFLGFAVLAIPVFLGLILKKK